jgi:Spy/CpxP family protein refolding chaperone
MKKQIVAVAMVAGLILAGTASAKRGNGNGYSDCSRYSNNQGGMMCQQLDQATQDKVDQFRDDNQGLRKEIVMKRAEKRALLNSTNPDSAMAAKIAGELFDLRTTMRVKAQEAGVDQYMRHRGMGSGAGDSHMGRRGQGSGSKGNGGGGCQGGNRF